MKGYISKMGKEEVSKHTIRKTKFGDIMRGIRLGGAYCFDEEAYNKFYPLAQKEGLEIGAEDFSGETPTGMHFVRIQFIRIKNAKGD